MTRETTVPGLITSLRRGTFYAPVTVRVSLDRKGKAMTVGCDEIGASIQVVLDGLEELILPAWESDDAG